MCVELLCGGLGPEIYLREFGKARRYLFAARLRITFKFVGVEKIDLLGFYSLQLNLPKAETT